MTYMTTDEYFAREFRGMTEPDNPLASHILASQGRLARLVDEVQTLGFEWGDDSDRFSVDGLRALTHMADKVAAVETERATLLELYELSVRVRHVTTKPDEPWNQKEVV